MFILLLWYLDNVRPGKYGVAQPWYFPLTVSHNSEERTHSDLTAPHITEILLVRRQYGAGRPGQR